MPLFISSLQKTALSVARKWQNIPDTVSDDDIAAQGLISPQILELIMQVVMEMLKNCPQPASTFKRIKSYTDAKPLNRILNPDHIRTNWAVDRWMSRLGNPRTAGDVTSVREALVATVGSMDEASFNQLQTEIMFLGI